MLLDSVYGTIKIDDPLAIDLIASRPFQRLKKINQYGVVNFIVPTENYNRFDHSIGVYFLLRRSGCSREEQLAGLLHDVSHTAFSHVGDYVFQQTNHDKINHDSSYQDSIHLWYLKESGLSEILERHGLNLEAVDHKNPNFIALDQPLPNLCADRIEYNLQGGLLRGLLTKKEFEAIHQGLKFHEGQWHLDSIENGKKLAACSLIMTETLWGAAWEAISYRLTAEALIQSFAISLITQEEFHFSTDDLIWNKLIASQDPYIKERMDKMKDIHAHYTLTDHGNEDQLLKLKFFGINPLVITEKGIFPLTSLDSTYQSEFEHVKRKMEKGWAIKFNKI